VRELENLVKRIVLLQNEEWALEQFGALAPAALRARPVAPRMPGETRGGIAIHHVLEHVRWNQAEAARVLKISYKTLLRKMKEHARERLAGALAAAPGATR
jgi:DNA-binding NtrC family response regulator